LPVAVYPSTFITSWLSRSGDALFSILKTVNAKPHIFIVRIWLEPNQDGPGRWRASVLDPGTHERQYFSRPNELAQFWLEASPLWPLPSKEEEA